ncbi:MAG: hypothetical protein HY912_10545 [Desulfomonile tiedjei]|uniref:Uncharacterized protein n=1 Tax=Desulfomonile tiedjei TaxID=2358 RepID=A0A9D6V0Q3_9BACT|nr:hypothetical protein [Desulfomonile tiedjei]
MIVILHYLIDKCYSSAALSWRPGEKSQVPADRRVRLNGVACLVSEVANRFDKECVLAKPGLDTKDRLML